MCGIAGALGPNKGAAVWNMVNALHHRGPDDQQIHEDSVGAVGIARLSIVDAVGGGQPVFNETRDSCVVFNGEIYNHRALRSRLEALGHRFRSLGDTEVIIHAFEEWGPSCLEHLEGMFAFAIKHSGGFLIARDRYGIKPLYYVADHSNGTFLFASELKAILRHQPVNGSINEQFLAQRMVFGYGIGKETIVSGISQLPAGTCMSVTLLNGRMTLLENRYHQFDYSSRAIKTHESPDYGALSASIAASVKRHIDVDSEIAYTLSGGLDSSLLAMFANRSATRPLMTYTVSESDDCEDLLQARRLASLIGSTHKEVSIPWDSFLAFIPQLIIAEEQVSSLYALPAFALFKEIGEVHKVCINGEGADELFGGYPEYGSPDAKLFAMVRGMEQVAKTGVRLAHAAEEQVAEFVESRNNGNYLEVLFKLNLSDQLIRHHLEIMDKYAMASSVEVRVPFLDDRFGRDVGEFSYDQRYRPDLAVSKYPLKRVALMEFGEALVDATLRYKSGFPSAGIRNHSRFERICARIPDEYANKHPYRDFFSLGEQSFAKRDLLMFDLFRYLVLECGGALPRDFSTKTFVNDTVASTVVATPQ